MAGRRALGFGLAFLIEALLVLLLLTLGRERAPEVEKDRPTVITFVPPEAAAEAPAPRPEPEQQSAARPEPRRPDPEQPRPPQPAEPAATPTTPTTPVTPPAPAIIPMRWSLAPSTAPPRPASPARPVYGPVDNRSAAMRDSEAVGTAPNGQPLYAAEWYRQPDRAMMRSYLSSARGPGWGLIACRTAPDFRVEDCVALGEYPEGSQITRSALAAAWEFRVRPPRRGGQPLIGAWVRIRIDYH